MASGIVKRQSNRVDAIYEQPWGGVASNTDPSDIPPSCNTFADGLFIKNGRLCTAGWNKSQFLNYSNIVAQNYFSAKPISFIRTILIPTLPATAGGTNVLCAFTDLGQVYIYDPVAKIFNLDQDMTPFPAAPDLNISAIQVIAGVAYVSFFDAGVIYAYTPTVSYVPATNFVGGKYLMEIIGYLVAANTNQPTDTPPVKYNRYNWSAPFLYTTWDPAINRLAGFNTISEVQDQITGAFALGNVGYILRNQGISQLSPTGQALAPFAVTPLWESEFGIGCTYPDTFDQYGAVAVWANDNDIYAFFNGSVPQSITGTAKAAIYADINIVADINTTDYSYISGTFFNCSENSNIPELCYCLSIIHGDSAGTFITGIFWLFNFLTKTWTRQLVNLLAIINSLVTTPIVGNFRIVRARLQGIMYTRQKISFLDPIPTTKRIVGALVLYGVENFGEGRTDSFLFPFFNSDTGQPVLGGGDISPNCDMQFKQEEVRLGTQPTIRGVLVKAAGSGILNVSVNGTVFTPITVNSTTAKTYRSSGVYSGENPQLNVFGTNFSGVIVKANMLMTYEEGEPL